MPVKILEDLPSEYDSICWWVRDIKDERRHQVLSTAVLKIRRTQTWRKETDIRHFRLYGNNQILSFGVSNYNRPATSTGGRIGLNVVKNCSDAFVAKITKERPKVTFVTSGGDWDLQQRAKELEKFIDGQFYELGIYELAPRVILDSAIFGTGFLKFYVVGQGNGTRIKAERVFPWEILIDEQEGLYGEPRNIYQRRWVDRLVVAAKFGKDDPELRKKIMQAKRDTDETDGAGYDSLADQLLVTEAWHLPSEPNNPDTATTDGRHTIAIENCTLFDEPYACDHFPFVVFRRQHSPFGFWGMGLAEELSSLQYEINVLMQKIQRSFHLLGFGHWLIDKASKVNKQKISNDIDIIEYAGKEPKIYAANPVPEQIFTHLDRLYQRCYEITGISQLEAQSQKPKGLDSGKAIDSYLDITTERFNVAVRLYQQAFIEMAKMVLQLSRQIAKVNPTFDVMAPDKRSGHRIKFKEAELRDDEYLLKLFPTNALSDDPSERMAQVEQMAKANWLDAQDAKRLLDFPDLEESSDMENASFNAVQSLISKMLKKGVYKGPQPFLNLTQAMRQVQMALIKAWDEGVKQDRLELLRRWLLDAQAMLTQAPPPPPAAMPGNMALPPGTPGAPPPPAGFGIKPEPLAPAPVVGAPVPPPGTPVLQ